MIFFVESMSDRLQVVDPKQFFHFVITDGIVKFFYNVDLKILNGMT